MVVDAIGSLFNITNIIHMGTSVSQRLNILSIILKIRALHSNAVHPVICYILCEGWKFAHVWKTLACPHHVTKKRGLDSSNWFNSVICFYWSVCTKPGNWAVMYMCIKGIDFSLYFGTVPQCGILCLSTYSDNLEFNYFGTIWHCRVNTLYLHCLLD